MKTEIIKSFITFIEENDLFHKKDKILLAVSGGVDSVVMTKLFAEAGFDIGIAHCNFRLRGDESDGDEKFVISLAEELNIPVFIKQFDTKKHAATKNISTQMAARELRYHWFEEIRTTHGFKYIATAHHKNDAAETILLNLVKGTVLKGLHGILPKTKNQIIRPLLWAEKEEILEFVALEKIQYRDDSSNAENKYQRNLIRNQVIPILKKTNPDVVNTMQQNAMQRLQLEEWLQKQTQSLFRKLFLAEGKIFKCNINELKKSALPPAVLYQVLEDFGFSYTQIVDLINSLDETEHKRFYSHSHLIIKERNEITISPINKKEDTLKTSGNTISADRKTAAIQETELQLEKITVAEITELKNPLHAYLDIKKISFPLQIRKWQAGDYFYPAGMKGRKKLSDYFTDIKASAWEKEQQLLLISGDQIAWIIGKRTDSRFMITEETEEVLKISMI